MFLIFCWLLIPLCCFWSFCYGFFFCVSALRYLPTPSPSPCSFGLPLNFVDSRHVQAGVGVGIGAATSGIGSALSFNKPFILISCFSHTQANNTQLIFIFFFSFFCCCFYRFIQTPTRSTASQEQSTKASGSEKAFPGNLWYKILGRSKSRTSTACLRFVRMERCRCDSFDANDVHWIGIHREISHSYGNATWVAVRGLQTLQWGAVS